MLSPTAIFPQFHFFPAPSLFGFQDSVLSKQRKCSRTARTNEASPSISRSHSFQDSSPSYSYQKDPDAGSLDAPWPPPSLDSGLLGSWLQSCSSVKEVRRVHAVTLRCLLDSIIYVDNNLITAYLRFHELVQARKVFDKMPKRNVVSWSALINGYLRFGLDEEAWRLLKRAVESRVRGNHKFFVCILNLCGRKFDLLLGRQIHACILKGNWRNLISDTAVVYFYAQCSELSCAIRAFEEMPERDVVCWTTMIAAYSQLGDEEKAFSMFSRMLADGFSPNEFTICSVLKACGDKRALRLGRQLHGAIAKKIFEEDVYVGSSLVNMYAKCGEVLDSTKVFNGMRKRNTVSWTSIIDGYAQTGHAEKAIVLFRAMKTQRVYVNNMTFVSILRACGSIGALNLGKEVHAQVIKNCTQTNIYVATTLVWMYCKCREYTFASKVLQQMAIRDVVSWTAMISGCADFGHEFEALGLLNEMLEEGVEPNSFTYSSALKACTKLKAFVHGKLIHSSTNKTSAASSNVFVASALTHMYGKSGEVAEAFRVFQSMEERNLVSWLVMILCYARNGFCLEALTLMYKMEAEGYEVDEYTLVAVLNACGGAEWDVE